MKKAILKVVLFSVFALPAAYLVLYSLASNWMFPAFLPRLTFKNWQLAFVGGSNGLLQSLVMGLALALVVSFFTSTLAFFTSRFLFLSRHSEVWKKLAILPFVISPVIYAVSLNFYFNYANSSATFLGVFLAQVFLVYPYAMLLFSGFWTAKHSAMQQLVATLGGNTFMQWKSGIWPQSKLMYFTVLFHAFLVSWCDFGLTQYIGLGKVKTLSLQVYQLVLEGNPYLAAVASVILILPPLLFAFINKNFILKEV